MALRDSDGDGDAPCSSSASVAIHNARTKRRSRVAAGVRGGGGGAGGSSDDGHDHVKVRLERRFKKRYETLQRAYEQRLQQLGLQVQTAVHKIHEDASLQCLQDNPLTSEYTSLRLEELVHECFHGEREKYIETLHSQLVWYRDEASEWKTKYSSEKRKEKEMEAAWHSGQRELQRVQQQLDARVQELRQAQRHNVECEERARELSGEKQQLHFEVETLKQELRSMETLRHEFEMLKIKTQNESEHERATQDQLKQIIERLQAQKVQWETTQSSLEKEVSHLNQQLSIAETKETSVASELNQLQNQNYPLRILALENTLEQQRQNIAVLENDNEMLRKKYEEFGAEVEIYMDEQAKQQASAITKEEEKVSELQKEMEQLRRAADESAKAKQGEVVRLVDQLRFRQEALHKLEQKNTILEEKLSATESKYTEEKIRVVRHVAELEKEITQWKHLLENEKEKYAQFEQLIFQQKEQYEDKLQAIKVAMDQQNQQALKEKELDARNRWQSEFVTKQEARIEALKEKYEAALEKQQIELISARTVASETASKAAAALDDAKRRHRDEEEAARKQRLELLAREADRKDEDRKRVQEQRRVMQELEDRERRLAEQERNIREREGKLQAEKIRLEESRKRDAEKQKTIEALKIMNEAKSQQQSPSVVVVRVNADDQETKTEDRSMHRRSQSPLDDEEPRILRAQHRAELEAKEAQVALQYEERIQKAVQECQAKKEKEFRAAMVNVRKGIQKLETSLEESKQEKKMLEEQLTQERQVLVSLRHENEELKEGKHKIIQRLDEANINIGKLRGIVKEMTARNQILDEELAMARDQNSLLEGSVQRETSVSLSLRADLVRLKTDLEARDAELAKVHMEINEIVAQKKNLQKELVEQRETYETSLESARLEEIRKVEDLVSDHEDVCARLQEEINKVHGENAAIIQSRDAIKNSLDEVTRVRTDLEKDLLDTRNELQKQRKEFNDLARLHKNFKEKLDESTIAADVKRNSLEEDISTLKMLMSVNQVERHGIDRHCQLQIRQLRTECSTLRHIIEMDLQLGWTTLRDQLKTAATEWVTLSESRVREEAKMWQYKEKMDKKKWNDRLERKEEELKGLLINQQSSDQDKYDQLVALLESKSAALEMADARLQQEQEKVSDLQRSLAEGQLQLQVMRGEQSSLREQLANSETDNKRLVGIHHDLQQDAELVITASNAVHQFVVWVLREFGLDDESRLCQGDISSFTNTDIDLAQEIQNAKNSLRQAWRERVHTAESQARAPIESEINEARQLLESFMGQGSSSTTVARFPWYTKIVQALESKARTHLEEIEALTQKVREQAGTLEEEQRRGAKISEANAVLRFEKETLAYELGGQLNELKRRAEQELKQLRQQHDRVLDQLKTRFNTEKMQLQQEHESALEALRISLESERKKAISAKDEMMTHKADAERTCEDLSHKLQNVQKENEELRETISKWKKKTKAMKTFASSLVKSSSNVPRHGMSSSTLEGTDESDTSYPSLRSVHPLPPSSTSAMTDLSNLMEQSLMTLRKRNENLA